MGVSIISVIFSTIIGFLAVYIAYRQWKSDERIKRLEELKFKHELFEKRFAIYLTARNFLRDIVVNSSVTNEMLINFWNGISSARFLLNDDLTKYLEDLEHKAVDLQLIQIEAKEIGTATGAKARGDLKKWFHAQIGILNKKFFHYLHIDESNF